MSSRLFFALWPGEEIRQQLADAVDSFPRRLGRRVPAHNLHITLVFLGQVEDGVRERLAADAARIRGRPFELVINASGWWRGPRVAWLAPADVPESLGRLAADLEAAGRARGISLEDRPYKPHLTFARKVGRAPPPRAFAPVRWPVSEFCLVESRAAQGGSAYHVAGRWPLMESQFVG